ncbi:MAG: hypothetical protein JHC81_09925 [Brevundimonas sp.]|uniref:hypothetical protein n=1 Tax=Brevundimonas sp. TaxID=1871086 RepID=UPI001A3095F0|nr:hypothetical protein [Brevundimonas sp.]MBJ7447841.1 hypothetical protein [Brevundimonas sp.]
MRAHTPILVALGIVLSACGGSTVRTFTPISEAAVKFQKPFNGYLIFTDDRRMSVSKGRLLGNWVCGDRSGYADFCADKFELKGIQVVKYKPGAAEVLIAAPVLSSTILIWVGSEKNGARETQRLEQEVLDEHRVAVENGWRPNLTLELWQASENITDCGRKPRADLELENPEMIAAEIWRNRERCLDDASEWYALTGEPAKARTLYFVHAARQRYERLACGLKDQGLRAPRPELVFAAPAGWMEDYKNIVQGSATYDYVITTKCNTSNKAALDSDGFPLEAARADALAKATSSFPLTEFADPE